MSSAPAGGLLVIAGIVPLPGETGDDWLDAWPDVPTRYLLCTEDRFFPVAWMRGVVQRRLGIVPDEIQSGHCPALSHPGELVARLEAYREALP